MCRSKRYRTLAILLALVAFLLGSGLFVVSRSGNLPFRRVAVVGRGAQEITGWQGGLYYGKYYGAIAGAYAKPVSKTCSSFDQKTNLARFRPCS
ncbi:hypothetical protein BSKO_11283 [Bryopsis sp. KO-2023]|nr:hypothetical protein BSKO_11283 [Bryopsis sp. KO-2023]